MRTRFVLFIIAALWCSVALGGRDAAEDAYERARRDYYALKDDAHRRKYRHNWLNVVRKFEAMAQKFPKSARAPDALFTSAGLLGELSRISMLDEDLQHAIADYEKLIDGYPKDNLSDDAALALARIHVERTGKIEAARRVLAKAVDTLPKGDARGKILALQSSLPTEPERPATGTRIAARRDEAVPPAEPTESAEKKVAATAKPEPKPEQKAPAKVDAPAPGHPDSRDLLLEAIARAAGERDASARVAEPAVPEVASAPSKSTEPVAVRPEVPGTAASRAEPAPAQKSGSTPTPAPEAVAAAPTTTPAEAKARLGDAVKPGASEITLAEQLGLKVRRVVIDAGHGGHDTGAIGKKGTREKDVTLAVSRRVAEILSERGLEVILTRNDDTYVRLEDRSRIANEAKGDLFISIHCNAAESRKLRGIETYSLNVAGDRYSIRLAARENASSEKSISDLQFILADLATKANTDESQRLAARVQRSLVTRLSSNYREIKDLGTKEALFYVLLGAKMPAILVEASFLSHPEEEKRLASKAYQDHIAQSVAEGIEAFLADRQRVAKVD